MSRQEWRASDSIPRLPVKKPIINLDKVRKTAASTESNATRFFSLKAVLLLIFMTDKPPVILPGKESLPL
jgi:hypothetical protein